MYIAINVVNCTNSVKCKRKYDFSSGLSFKNIEKYRETKLLMLCKVSLKTQNLQTLMTLQRTAL